MGYGMKLWRAVHRPLSLVYTYVVTLVLQAILIPLALLWMAVDLLLVVVPGSDGLSTGGWIPTMTISTFKWAISNNTYALFGKGSFRWVPMPA